MVFSPLLWIKTISNIFVTDISNFLMKFWEISKKCSNFVNFRAKKMFFFLNRSEFHQKKIGSVISDLMTTKCDIWRHFWWTIILTYVRMLAHCALSSRSTFAIFFIQVMLQCFRPILSGRNRIGLVWTAQ